SSNEKDFECFAKTGVKSPLNAIFEQTKTRYPQTSASRIVLSCELRKPMENRHPRIYVSRSRTPNRRMPSRTLHIHHARRRCAGSLGSRSRPERLRGGESDDAFCAVASTARVFLPLSHSAFLCVCPESQAHCLIPFELAGAELQRCVRIGVNT